MNGTALGPMLAAARRERGWSLREAERRSGVRNAHLSQIETGAIRKPSLVVLAGLAGAYGIPLRDLVVAAGLDGDSLPLLTEAEIRADERARVDNAVNWQTSCLNCATLLDSCYAETCRREQAEEKLAAVRALAGALGDRSAEPRERTQPSDRRLMEPLRRMLLEILDGAR